MTSDAITPPAQDATPPIAAIDVGTNSIHMIVVEREGRGYRVLDREKEMVQLGSGALSDGTLSDDAIERAVRALQRMSEIASSLGVSDITAFATSATREASNRDVLISRAKDEAGIDIQVISGEEEADLIYRAVCAAVDFESKIGLIVDIGGGSVEIVSGTQDELFYASSVPIGALRLTERFFQDDPPRTKALARCRRFIRKKLRRTLDSVAPIGFDFVIGTSGTIQTLARMTSDDKEEGSAPLEWLSRDQLDELIARMSGMTVDERASTWGIDARRARVILAGALVLEHVLYELRATELRSCTAAMREGMIARLVMEPGETPDFDVRRSAVLDLASRSKVDLRHAEHVEDLAMQIFDQTASLHGLDEEARELLGYAALLHDAGQHLSFRAHHKHAYYMIRHSGLRGFTHRQIRLVANVARYHRKAKPSGKHPNFAELTDDERDVVRKLSAILRLAEGLDRGRRHAVDEVRIEIAENRIRLNIESRVPPTVELDSARRSARYFEKVFGRAVRFEIVSRS